MRMHSFRYSSSFNNNGRCIHDAFWELTLNSTCDLGVSSHVFEGPHSRQTPSHQLLKFDFDFDIWPWTRFDDLDSPCDISWFYDDRRFSLSLSESWPWPWSLTFRFHVVMLSRSHTHAQHPDVIMRNLTLTFDLNDLYPLRHKSPNPYC